MSQLLLRICRGGSGRAAWLAALALVLPVLVCGPWLPFADLVAFCGIDSYPPQLSYGPFHYYLFQFTYILPLALSRLCVDLGLGVKAQVPLFYLAQMGAGLFVVWKALDLLVPESRWRGAWIVLGALAGWDGLFLWGGPFAYSMGAALLALVLWLSLREASAPERTAHGLVALLALLAVASHPFSLPFALLLFGARVLVLRRSRWQSGAMIAVLLVYQVVISRENPEPVSGPILTQLFAWFPPHPLARCAQLLDWNSETVDSLFSVQPPLLVAWFILLALVRAAGFLCAPVVAWRARSAPALRMLALLETGVFVLWLFARDNTLISMWPQRILTFHSTLLWIAGVACPLWLWQQRAPGGQRSVVAADTPGVATTTPGGQRSVVAGRLLPAVEAALALILVAVQFPILRLGPSIEENLRHTRAELLASGLHDAVLVSRNFDVKPFYLRCVPFLLFSDPEIVERHLLFSTEWHAQPRHPSRLSEMALNFGRKRYNAIFTKKLDGPLELLLEPVE